MSPTKLIYLEDFNLLSTEAKVLEVSEEEGRNIVFLDQTIFYPQGGGQPWDQGIIESVSGKFLVEEVRFVDGLVRHIGKFESDSFKEGEIVRCAVNEARRTLHSRIHSAGHVVDMAIFDLGLQWTPGKGYHFPEGPYVEYVGSIGEVDKEQLRIDIESSCNKFVTENRETKLVFMPKEKMHEVCHNVPDYLPEGKPARVVMYGDFGVPCGGTHVNSLADIGKITIRKVKPEGQKIKVGYDVSRG